EYRYTAEQGQELDCVPSNRLDLQWYYRALYPTEVLWSSNTSQGMAAKLRVAFVYVATDRLDWNIEGAEEGPGETECKQVKFARRDQLNSVSVQVEAGGWQTLRSYALLQSYSTSNQRILLNTLEERGKNNALFRLHSFTYEGTTLNAIRLKTADNGWGGKVTYTYTAHPPSASSSICNGHCRRNAVTRTVVDDGTGHSTQMDYFYGPTTMPSGATGRWQWSAIDNTGEFMGFYKSEATYYDVKNSAVPAPPIIKWDMQETWQGGRDNPDPQRGKLKHHEIRTAQNGTLLASGDYDWKGYRRAHSGCASVAGWCTLPTTASSHYEGADRIYHTLWLRLENSNEWRAGAGTFTQHMYAATQQNNLQFGNLTEVQEWSHAEASLDAAGWQTRVAPYLDSDPNNNTTLTLLRRTTTDYFPNAPLNLVSQPARIRIYAPGGACQSEMRMVYDQLDGNYNSSPSVGLVAKTQQALTACSDTAGIGATDANWTETRRAYDAYGNPTIVHHVGATPAGDDHTITVYDPVYRLFPVEQYSNQNSAFKETATYYGVNGLGLTDTKAYWGALQEHCAVNEVCTRQSYDEWGRHTRRWEAVAKGSGWASDAISTVYWNYRTPLHDAGFKTTVVTEWRAPRCEGTFVRRHYNGLGQLVITQTPDQLWADGVDGCTPTEIFNEIETLVSYNGLGQPVRTSVPYRTTVNWATRAYAINWGTVWASRPHTLTSYDSLSRPLTVTAPNGEGNYYTYDGRNTALWDAKRGSDPYDKVLKRTDLNGLGQVQT
ncbi:MAG: hypothetical protein M3Q45_01850, partial [Chloroflexota bacterium]|nr:hypothetical protein [Chloroflexota bacterium]